MSQLKFAPKQENVIRTTPITNERPGSILHDFQVLLDFVTEETVYLTNAHMLPMKVLEPLNQRLISRIEHALARPVQKSLPNLNGLFLLLRSSGLTTVDVSERKPMLVVDPLVVDSWRELNPEERYFAL